jgi:hypothetical protein
MSGDGQSGSETVSRSLEASKKLSAYGSPSLNRFRMKTEQSPYKNLLAVVESIAVVLQSIRRLLGVYRPCPQLLH